jgi:hypothetical protein
MMDLFLTSQRAENVNALCEAFGSFHARYFGPQPLIEDNSAIGKSSLTFDGGSAGNFRNF